MLGFFGGFFCVYMCTLEIVFPYITVILATNNFKLEALFKQYLMLS